MQIKISFNNMKHSDPIEQHTREKLEKLHELLKNDDLKPPFYVEFWLKANKPHPHHKAELHLKTSTFDLHSHDEGTDLYVAIDNTIDKMIALVRKEKAKKRDKYMKAENEKRSFIENEDKYTL
jgi:ribosomal subunit interface protein